MFQMSIKGYSFYFRLYRVLTKHITVNHLTVRSVVKSFSNRQNKARQFYEKRIQCRLLLTFFWTLQLAVSTNFVKRSRKSHNSETRGKSDGKFKKALLSGRLTVSVTF